MENRSFLLTGGTGFVGGSLAADLIDKGHSVIALSRNDRDGQRTFHSVAAAARGLGLLMPQLGKSLQVFNYDDTRPESLKETLERISKLRSVHSVVHAAAEMSYSLTQFQKSLSVNQYFTTHFYEMMSKLFKGCKRFYYVSTAYSAGPVNFPIEENIQQNQVQVNSYQGSKWATERSLSNCSAQTNLPITIVRPSIVIGSQANGWAQSKPFGFYMFLSGFFRAVKKIKKNKLRVDLLADNHINLVSIDQVNEAMTSLISANANQGQFEVVNLVPKNSENNKTKSLLKLIGNALETKLECGAPGSLQEKLLNKSIQLNKIFAKHTWDFKTGNYRRITGKEIKALSLESIVKVIRYYYQKSSN